MIHDNGHAHQSLYTDHDEDTYSDADLVRHTCADPRLLSDEKRDFVFTISTPSAWLVREALEVFAEYRVITEEWEYILQRYEEIGGKMHRLALSVDAIRKRARLAREAEQEAHAPTNDDAPGPEPVDPFACPELPGDARVNEDAAASASRFLDDYIAHSQKWAPRAYAGFHEAVALFVLATTAARRVRIEHGPLGTYTSLFLALASRTSLYAKTTTADIGLALLRRAGLHALLADDDATPQAFLRSLTLYVPPDYAELSQEAQEALRLRLAFAGQKGWFYEEWGQHLHAMMQKEGLMAAFRGILRRLDDHKEEYTTVSIARGRDVLTNPYVTLLANVTPADLVPHLRTQSPLWRDGYLARFAFVTPGDTPATTTPFPEGAMQYPNQLLTALQSWHKRLGVPRVVLEPVKDAKDKPTARYQPSFLYPHRATTYTLHEDVRAAFYRYDAAMHHLMRAASSEDLDGSYARFPTKALRIAGLLASLHDDDNSHEIRLIHWSRGQQIAERWRHDLHVLRQQLDGAEAPTRESKGEKRVSDVLRKHGALSAVEIHRWTKLAHADIQRSLVALQHAGAVVTTNSGRTLKYRWAIPRAEESPM